MIGIKNTYIDYINLEITRFIENESVPLIHCEDNFIGRSDFIKKLSTHELSGVLFNGLVNMLLKNDDSDESMPLSLSSIIQESYDGYSPIKIDVLNDKQKESIKSELSAHFDRMNELIRKYELHDIDDLISYDCHSVVVRGKPKVLDALYDIHSESNSVCNLFDAFHALMENKINYNNALLDRDGYLSKEETFFCRKMSEFFYSSLGVKGYQVIANFINILFDKKPFEYFTIQTVAQRVSRGRRNKSV